MFRHVSLIVKNVWRNRRRTALTIGSIGVSMCLLGVIITAYYAFFLGEPSAESALRLVTRNRISLVFSMPESYAARIRQVPGVREVMISQWYGGTYKDARDPKNFFARFAVEPEKVFRMYSELRVPEDQKRAFERERTACAISQDLVQQHGFRLGDRIVLMGDIFPGSKEFTVRAIFQAPRREDVMYFHRAYLEEGLPPARRGNTSTFMILADQPESVPRIASAVDDMFRNAPVQTRTETEQAFTLSFLSFLGNVKLFLISICAAVMFTILLVSANTMAMSVRERVREVGILKTLGFAPGAILGIILGEACGIAMAGGALGFILSLPLVSAIRNGPFGGFFPSVPAANPTVAAACFGTALTIGVLSALIPAWKASHTPIVEALRSTD